jgi:hypothetical protein
MRRLDASGAASTRSAEDGLNASSSVFFLCSQYFPTIALGLLCLYVLWQHFAIKELQRRLDEIHRAHTKPGVGSAERSLRQDLQPGSEGQEQRSVGPRQPRNLEDTAGTHGSEAAHHTEGRGHEWHSEWFNIRTGDEPARAQASGGLGERETHPCATLSAEAAARVVGDSELAELSLTDPLLAHDVELIRNDTEWLQCFWSACDQDTEATAALVRSYATSSRAFRLDEPRVAQILSARLIEILMPPGDSLGDQRPAVAVVRDIQVMGQLLQAHSFQDVVAAHLIQLQRLLRTDARARRHGVSMVQDLSGLSLSLVGSLMDPRNLQVQIQAARLLLTDFPVRWKTTVIVDAPSTFGMLLNAVKAVVPIAIDIHFVSRPEAESRCERIFGQRVL